MTEEQKFFFDLRGWILLPGVLSEEEICTMKAEAYGVDDGRMVAAVDKSQAVVSRNASDVA